MTIQTINAGRLPLGAGSGQAPFRRPAKACAPILTGEELRRIVSDIIG